MPQRAEVVRFAPSPTGELHLGNMRTALFNWLLAKETGGTFVQRLDDTDEERSKAHFAELIGEDLAWLGIVPDRQEKQSARLQRYDGVANQWREEGLLYPCYETAEELDRKRARQRARGQPPVYDRAALNLSDEERAAFEAEGRRPHWRFKLPGGERTFDDLCRGPQTVHLESVSDPVLVRGDGSYLYTLPSVVDDVDFNITTVVRGEDHVTNSGVQIALFEALGAAIPTFAHHNLLVRADGEPLSKRDNPLSVRALREAGFEPMAVASLATLVGTSAPIQAMPDLDALGAAVSLRDVSRGPATFDPKDLERLNAILVHALDYDAVKSRLESLDAADPALWEAVRGNLTFVQDVAMWRAVQTERPALSADSLSDSDRSVLSQALTLLPPEPWDETTFKAWTQAVREATGAKGKGLFMPIRLALTGVSAGPELGPFMRLLGREETAARLQAAA
ncbi:MAG: glutamate--tRNA ligase [Pseudomonadota bacterium]